MTFFTGRQTDTNNFSPMQRWVTKAYTMWPLASMTGDTASADAGATNF
jgi:hypothetical protein